MEGNVCESLEKLPCVDRLARLLRNHCSKNGVDYDLSLPYRAFLNVCFSYTSRDEICCAMRDLAEGVQLGLIRER